MGGGGRQEEEDHVHVHVIYCECGKITDCAALARLLLRLLNNLSCQSIIHLKNSHTK